MRKLLLIRMMLRRLHCLDLESLRDSEKKMWYLLYRLIFLLNSTNFFVSVLYLSPSLFVFLFLRSRENEIKKNYFIDLYFPQLLSKYLVR